VILIVFSINEYMQISSFDIEKKLEIPR